jgi:hypothetical protein
MFDYLKKRYWFIAWSTYYPLGGLRNVRKTYDTIEEAEEDYAKMMGGDEDGFPAYDNCQLYDSVRAVLLRDDEIR